MENKEYTKHSLRRLGYTPRIPCGSAARSNTKVYIDGFNLYHAVRNFNKELKWLNPIALVQQFNIFPSEMDFFTANPTHRHKDQILRHRNYAKVLSSLGITVKNGKFKKKKRGGHEEKQTDVFLATTVIEDFYSNRVNDAVIVSNDSDFVPVIKSISRYKKEHPDCDIKLRFIVPSATEHRISGDLTKAMLEFYDHSNAKDKKIKKAKISIIKNTHLEHSGLPDEIELENKIYKNPYKEKLHYGECECVLCKQIKPIKTI